ncbi:LysE family transporter [Streptomyces sp. TP-A0356]|uniref:LysE family transporter n=1 Tax=Streptomyces sp. TP-A0356 TaxID=1359208 RepID=UPI0006E2C339|nr:LysE family transporter [Streptomyces sp. TP-A0356]
MTGALVAGLVAGYGIAVPVGAIGTYLVSLTARTSLRTGACAALGVATADGLYALVAVIGSTTLSPVLHPVVVPLRWASALVLAALSLLGGVGALRRYRSAGAATAVRAEPPGAARAYLGLLGITLLNPATVVYFAALVLGSRAGDPLRPLEQGLFVVAAFAASASWQLALAGGGALLGRALAGRRGQLVTALVSSAVIAALAVRMVVLPA